MGLGQIRFGGLASGLDTNAIIEAMLGVERAKIYALEARKDENQKRISLFGTLEGLVKTLQEKAEALSGSDSLLGFSVSSSDESVASFTITGSAPAGAHTLQVDSLASADRYAFDGVTDPDADMGAGTLSFDYDGTSYSFNGGVSLNALAAQINTDADGEVRASVVNAGTSANPSYQLVLAGEDTGESYTIDNLVVSIFDISANPPTRISSASNAQVVVDGLTVVRESNIFSDVVPGISFTAQAVTSGAISFDVSLDSDATKENLNEFIDAYNAVVGFINDQSSYDEEEGVGGLLFGDSALRSIRQQLHSAIYSQSLTTVMNDPDGYSTLGLVGVDLQSDGTLQLDESKFDDKLLANPDALEEFFSDSTNGILVALDEVIDEMVKGTTDALGNPLDGVFDRRRDTLNALNDDLDDEIESMERSMESLEQTLVAQFASLESLMSSLQAQSTYLTSSMGFTFGNTGSS
jgi:flagellar hook-associated protein 2